LIDPVGATVLAVAGVSEASIALDLLTTGRRSTSWPRVRGFVHRAWTPLLGQVLTGWAPPALKYEYVVNGVVHYGSRVRYGGYFLVSQARRARYRYEAGAHVDVYYDPRKPERAVLEPGPPGYAWLMLVTGVLLAAVGLYFAFSSAAA